MFENIGTQQKEEIIWCQNQKYQTTKFFTENLLVIEIKKSDFFFFHLFISFSKIIDNFIIHILRQRILGQRILDKDLYL